MGCLCSQGAKHTWDEHQQRRLQASAKGSWHIVLQQLPYCGTFFTLRMSLTALVLAACGPPTAMVAEMSSLYILQMTALSSLVAAASQT